ncbi:MAG: helix-turn-helix transcriptional regulator [Clostridia bacterium]|nr:helix-turn-helix transcriptional regulator [Clostridia bacterium]MBR2433567.1 helix-turn-helix transcriptional regulator [Clostridia bacterium]
MKNNRAFALRVVNLLIEKKMSKYKLEQKSGLSHSALRYIFNEVNTDIKFSTIVKIVGALDMTLEEFFDDELFEYENLESE